jgi:hypothetical protein
MARYKPYSYEQAKLIPLSFSHQIQPGSFEYALSYIVDVGIDLSQRGGLLKAFISMVRG